MQAGHSERNGMVANVVTILALAILSDREALYDAMDQR